MTKPRELTPAGMAPPAAAYAHAIQLPAGSDLVVTSGVVPTKKDGSVPALLSEQAGVVWQNIAMILAEAEMTMSDIISVTTYLVNTADIASRLAIVMSARDSAMAGHRAASTLVTVPALARQEWQLEISVLAARHVAS